MKRAFLEPGMEVINIITTSVIEDNEDGGTIEGEDP